MSNNNNNAPEIFSPRRPEKTSSSQITPRRPLSTSATATGAGTGVGTGTGGLGTGTISGLGTGGFLKELDRIQEQQMHFAKRLEKEKRKKHEIDNKTEVTNYSLRSLSLSPPPFSICLSHSFSRN